MNKKVAIKTGPSVTKEEGNKNIKFLESLGGINMSDLSGTTSSFYYYINEFNNITGGISLPRDYMEIISLKDYQEQYTKTINYQDI